jgi:hypothetical protein
MEPARAARMKREIAQVWRAWYLVRPHVRLAN